MKIIQNIKKSLEDIDSSKKPQRLLLELSEAEIRMEIYHQGELSSRMLQLELDIDKDGVEAYFKELKRVLSSEQLWKLEHKAEIVFFLPEDWCYVDRLELPKMDKRELERTIEWELEQFVPWPRNNYYYDKYEDADNHNYVVAAAPALLIDGLVQVGQSLNLTVSLITTTISAAGYLAGKPYPNLLSPKQKRFLRMPKEKRKAKLILVTAAVISVIMVVVSLGLRQLAADGLINIEARLQQLVVWEQQFDWSQAAKKRIEHLQRTMAQLNEEKRNWQPHLELWSKCAGSTCWLESALPGKSDAELTLRGKGVDVFAVAQFVQKLKASGFYKNVELAEFATEKDGTTSFMVRLQMKDNN